jgi:hypothetical protein
MGDGDRQALEDILTVLDRALRFPKPDFETLEATDFGHQRGTPSRSKS